MSKTLNVRVSDCIVLPTPAAVRQSLPLPPVAEATVLGARAAIDQLLSGGDPRLLAVVGPCSVHDPAAAFDYAVRLKSVSRRLQSQLLIVMRVYFEKPRTVVGWKGYINDPHLDGSHDVRTGLFRARQLLIRIAELGVPAATEFLDPITPRYIADLISWAAIGARTTESQTHRELASGLSMPVGFKNGTDGSLDVALNAMRAAANPHSFLGIDEHGRVSVLRTRGNRSAHLVLRGGTAGPNYAEEHIAMARQHLRRSGLCERPLIDCAHGNSGKDVRRQAKVAREVTAQLAAGQDSILGVMLESNLRSGHQELAEPHRLTHGVSITDPCLDFETTETLLEELAASVARRQAGRDVA